MLETAIPEENSPLIFEEKGSGLSMLNHLLQKNYIYCKRQRILPTPPLMSDLTAERVSVPTSPFIHTGIDYFGPLFVKFSTNNQVISNNFQTIRSYIYILSFTCFSYRISR